MKGIVINISLTNGKWLINGKMFCESNLTEQRTFIYFLNNQKE